MATTIIASYTLNIYSDGSIEYIPLTNDEIELKSNNTVINTTSYTDSSISGRIYQICSLIKAVDNRLSADYTKLSEQNFKNILSESINDLANNLGIAPQTINDKITRQLGYNKKSQFTQDLFDFFKNGIDAVQHNYYNESYFNKIKIVSIIHSKVTSTKDSAFVNETFANLFSKLNITD